MSDERGWDTVADLAGEALADRGDCPPPEAFLQEELDRLDADPRARIQTHADGCPRCGAERILAQAFDSARQAGSAPAALDEAFVLRALRRPDAGAPSRRSLRRVSWGLTAAAGVILMVAALGALVTTRHTPPDLPGVPPEGTERGAQVRGLEPEGDLDRPPRAFRWAAASGAASYRMEVTDVEGMLVWEGSAKGPPVLLDATEAGRFRRAVVYTWVVEAMDAAGNPVARSKPARFRVRPEASTEEVER